MSIAIVLTVWVVAVALAVGSILTGAPTLVVVANLALALIAAYVIGREVE